jgi:RimJ/RimL family protein N-acetyltransferase
VRELHIGDLVLEPLRTAHAEAMYEVLCDPRLYSYLDYPPPPDAAHVRGVYERLERRKSPDGADHWLNWIVRHAGGPPLGFVQATMQQDGDTWIAYVIGTAQQGRGIGTQATQAMLEHLASDYGAARFLASVEAGNAPSIRLLQRLGFTLAADELAARHEMTASERLFVRDT